MAKKITIKKHIAMYLDLGENLDYKPRILAICDTREEAINEVHADIQKWADDRAGENIEVDFDKFSAKYKDTNIDTGCEWSIEERDIEVEIPE